MIKKGPAGINVALVSLTCNLEGIVNRPCSSMTITAISVPQHQSLRPQISPNASFAHFPPDNPPRPLNQYRPTQDQFSSSRFTNSNTITPTVTHRRSKVRSVTFFASCNPFKHSSHTRLVTSTPTRLSSSKIAIDEDCRYCALNFAFLVAGCFPHISHNPGALRRCI